MELNRIKYGTIREDGKIFQQYLKRGDKRIELWLSPEAFARTKAKVKADHKKRYAANPEKYRAIGVDWYNSHPDYYTQYEHDYQRQEHPDIYHFKRALNAAKNRAKRKGLEFNIDLDYIISLFPADRVCPVFGMTMRWGRMAGRHSSPSIDRIDNERGYVPGNIWWISWQANSQKRQSDLNTFLTRSRRRKLN